MTKPSTNGSVDLPHDQRLKLIDMTSVVTRLVEDYRDGFLSGKGFQWKLTQLLHSKKLLERLLIRGGKSKLIERNDGGLSMDSINGDLSSSSQSSVLSPSITASADSVSSFSPDSPPSSTRAFSTGRRLLDAYADSLKRTNQILNRAYGFVSRKGIRLTLSL